VKRILSKIKNIDLIKHLLTEDQLQDLETGATLPMRNGRIEFKILEANEDEVIIRVTQGESLGENFISPKELATRGKDLLKHFFPEKTIHTRTFSYSIPKADEVNM
jgi:pyruvate kinase